MDLLGLLRAGISDINIGMQQFSEMRKTKIMMDLDKYSLDEQMQVVDTMVYQRGRRTMTGNALTMVADQVGIINLCFILYNRKENYRLGSNTQGLLWDLNSP
jgi:hypothetical protein